MEKMKQFSNRMQYNIAKFMYGRCGFDHLARASYFVALILLVVEFFVKNPFVSLASMGFFIYSLWRIFSRKIDKRYAENQKFLELMRKPKSTVNYWKMQWRDRKTSKYFTCTKCHQHIRVPKGPVRHCH